MTRRKCPPRIVSVEAKPPFVLRLLWDSGEESLVDASSVIETFRVYAPLRDDPDLFSRVRLGDCGTDIVWTDEIDMSADTLSRLA